MGSETGLGPSRRTRISFARAVTFACFKTGDALAEVFSFPDELEKLSAGDPGWDDTAGAGIALEAPYRSTSVDAIGLKESCVETVVMNPDRGPVASRDKRRRIVGGSLDGLCVLAERFFQPPNSTNTVNAAIRPVIPSRSLRLLLMLHGVDPILLFHKIMCVLGSFTQTLTDLDLCTLQPSINRNLPGADPLGFGGLLW